jgi:hypothetical protein
MDVTVLTEVPFERIALSKLNQTTKYKGLHDVGLTDGATSL